MQIETDHESLRYPIGRFQPRPRLSGPDIERSIDDLAALPRDLRAVVAPWPDERLDTRYRLHGWTVRQVVHHLPDSHMNSYVRCKLALTEAEPTVKDYDEAAWAELPDGRGADVEGSLLLLEAIHRRWASLLRSLDRAAFARTFRHPQTGVVTLERTLQLYVWHGRHHLAQVMRVAHGSSG